MPPRVQIRAGHHPNSCGRTAYGLSRQAGRKRRVRHYFTGLISSSPDPTRRDPPQPCSRSERNWSVAKLPWPKQEKNGNIRKIHLIWEALHANMGNNIMKTTIEISDDLFVRAQRLARREKTTFRALTEAGLRWVVSEKHSSRAKTLPPLITSGGDGLTDEFKDWNWDKILEESYRGRGT
jgi:hypothetical protein